MMSIRRDNDPDELRKSCSSIPKPPGVTLAQLAVAEGSAESTLNIQLRIHAALLDHTQDAILVRDFEDRILSWNKAAERLYGWEASEALGQNIYELLGLRHVAGFGDLTRALAERGEWTGQMRQLTKHGSEIIVESHWKVMKDEVGQPKSVLIVNTDLTERKRLESQFLRAQRMDNVVRMAGGFAHDLNNVLALMRVASHQLQRKLRDPDSQRWLKALRVNAEHAGHLITGLLSLAKGLEEERISLQPKGLIEETAEMLRTGFPTSVAIKTRISSKLWSILSSPTQLRQVLMNLCLNARDAMPKGGTLTIEGKNIHLKQATPYAPPEANPGNYVLLRVSDTGIGIPAEIVDKVFEPFFTTKQGKGTGLGLTAVLRIVKSHGGFIRVSSKSGLGTQFTVYLPAEVPEPVNFGELSACKGGV
jgi:two-component system, cell cycle sensor histidine kinase and response regulator CckA